jgi:hypothetical protein
LIRKQAAKSLKALESQSTKDRGEATRYSTDAMSLSINRN